jgi:hypothetical protein
MKKILIAAVMMAAAVVTYAHENENTTDCSGVCAGKCSYSDCSSCADVKGSCYSNTSADGGEIHCGCN